MAGSEQFGRGNIWASLKSLFNIDAGWYVFAGTPVNGTSGTYANRAGLGAVLLDSTTGNRFVNFGTKASPIWTADGTPVAAGQTGLTASGLGAAGNAKATYDFATDGGAISTITPTNSPTIPINAIILGGVLEVQVVPVGGGASIGVGLGSGAQVASLLAATAIAGAPWSTTGMKAVIPLFTVATYVKVAAATRLTFTVSATPLSAGRFNVNVVYLQGNSVP